GPDGLADRDIGEEDHRAGAARRARPEPPMRTRIEGRAGLTAAKHYRASHLPPLPSVTDAPPPVGDVRASLCRYVRWEESSSCPAPGRAEDGPAGSLPLLMGGGEARRRRGWRRAITGDQ